MNAASQASFPKKEGKALIAVERMRTARHIPTMTTEPSDATDPASPEPKKPADGEPPRPREIGGPKGPEPTRYGDWEKKGLTSDF